ncbi:MAG TPA: cellobiose phosphorylase, partial [Bacillota bacterium]|nr:cellobiose phosphorylase [Bacillota bacterium]
YQMIEKDKVDMEADFLIHKIIRSNSAFACEIESFVPYDDTYRELHKITFKNISSEPLTLKPVVSVPLFARSADNIRDHRHVTSLLNRLTIHENGMINQPTFSFDERGHVVNQNRYGVFVHSNPESKVLRYWPILEEFIGEGNTLLDPEVVSKEIPNSYKVGVVVSGYEMTGGFEFEALTLKSGETLELYLQIVIAQTDEEMLELHSELTSNDYLRLKNQTLLNWKEKLGHLEFSFSDEQLNGWLKWVTLQPILRRIYGCSFLPHHDYGRGGRGWRDLWQDSLALILMEPEEVRHLLFNNFLGVRIDGSNATIIGDAPGQFLADRNHIARVWMDHGSWPFITTKLYLDKSGDYAFLFEHQKYFSDQFSHYTKMVDNRHIDTEHIQKTESGAFYSGTILEHLIIQNLIPFFNVGNHNNIRIEGADWNDALDMASKKGESVAFTSLYASNLIEIGHLLTALHQKGIETIELLSELDILLGGLDFEDVHAKQSLLKRYFDSVYPLVKGDKTSHDVAKLSRKLIEYGQMLLEHVRANEWME